MKNLILVRHGKSSWETPLSDIDRPLNKRGISDAHLVFSNVKSFIPESYLIWSSTAKRASETALIFAQSNSYPIESILFDHRLYTFDEDQLEKVIKSCNDCYNNVILFGHNAAITNFVNKFGSIFIENVSTSGFVSLEFEAKSWQEIKKGITKKIIFPKDLK